MDLAEFSAEAARLARRATLLKASGHGEPVAYWHGVRAGSSCISLRGGSGWLNVHVGQTGGHVVATARPLRSPTPLFGEEVLSLPPVDAVFASRSSAIEEYLHRHEWGRADSFNDNFPDEVPKQYEKLWQQNCPMYLDDVVAVCGGWHFPWPDGDFHQFLASELVVWTIRDAEPWVEVFRKDGEFVVKQRVT